MPAYNEERNIGRVLDELRAFDPGLEVVVVSDGSTDRTAEVAAAARRARRSGCRSTSASAAPCRPASATPGRRATSSPSASTATASTTRRSSASWSRRCSRARPTSRSARASSASGGYRSSAARRVGIRVLAWVVSSIARQRVTDTTSGFQALNRRAIGALRRRPAARLPGGRGDRDGDPAPRCGCGGAGDDARARARPLVDRGARLGLLHGQGAARALRRPLPPQRRRRWRTHDAAQGLDRRDDRVARSCCSSSSS